MGWLRSLRYEGDTFANARILAALHPRQKENSVSSTRVPREYPGSTAECPQPALP